MNLRERSYCDRILRVDLTAGKSWITPLPAGEMPLLLGGKGLGAWLLYNEQGAHVDPLGPENQLIFHTGPLTGTTAPTAGHPWRDARVAVSDTHAFVQRPSGQIAVLARDSGEVQQVLEIDGMPTGLTEPVIYHNHLLLTDFASSVYCFEGAS